MIIDTIGCTYDSLEELMDRQSVIEEKIKDYIEAKGIADDYKSEITMAANDKFYLQIKLIKKD